MKIEFNPNLPSVNYYSPIRFHTDYPHLLNPIRYDMTLWDDFLGQQLTFDTMQFETMKHFLSLDALMLYFSGEFDVSDLEYSKLVEYLQALRSYHIDTEKKDLELITDNDIKQFIENTNLSDAFDQKKLYELVRLFLTELAKGLKEQDVLKLVRAEMRAEDAWESFLDNNIAMKGFFAKEASLYKWGFIDVMKKYLDRLFVVNSPNDSSPTRLENHWQLIPNTADASNLVHTNVIEIILYHEIVNNRLPKGILKVMLLPDRRVQKFDSIDLTLSIFKQNQLLKKFKLNYNLKTASVEIKELIESGPALCYQLKFKIEQGKIKRITGTYKNNAILVNISDKKKNVDSEKLILGAWHSNRIINQFENEDGILEKELEHKQKKLHIDYHVYHNCKSLFLVQKKITIGNDYATINYTYKNHIPIAVGASGYIYIAQKIKKKSPAIYLPEPTISITAINK